MTKRNAAPGTGKRAPWAGLAYSLWRYKHLSWEQIRTQLAVEGWIVSKSEIAAAVLDRAGDELRARLGHESGR